MEIRNTGSILNLEAVAGTKKKIRDFKSFAAIYYGNKKLLIRETDFYNLEIDLDQDNLYLTLKKFWEYPDKIPYYMTKLQEAYEKTPSSFKNYLQ